VSIDALQQHEAKMSTAEKCDNRKHRRQNIGGIKRSVGQHLQPIRDVYADAVNKFTYVLST